MNSSNWQKSNLLTMDSPLPGTFKTPTDTPTPGSMIDDQDIMHHSFQSIIPTPISVSRDQSNGIIVGPGSNPTSIQYSLSNLNIFQTLPSETVRGTDDLTRMRMALLSGIQDEIKWSLKKYLAYSNKAPYMISLKNLPDLLPLFKKFILTLKPLIETFDSPLVTNEQVMNDLQNGLNGLLILRNLAQDTESIQILIKDESIKEFILFVLVKFESLSLRDSSWKVFESNTSYFNELIHYVLDLMEAISSYLAPAKKDDLYFQNLISILNYTKDRYMIISILRSLSRLLVRSKEDEESAADNLDQKTLSLVVSFLLIECDSELIIAALDFLYQYILPGNQRISELLRDNERFHILCTMLPKLLTYNVKIPNYSLLANTEVKLVKRIRPAPPKNSPELNEQLYETLLKLNEPMRSTAWLKCCFEPVEEAEFTQIALWRSYESKFASRVRESGRKLLPAVEFIKNVSNAFHEATAMVVTDSSTGKKRFVIKGIQPRPRALTIEEGEDASRNPAINKLKSKFLDNIDVIKPAKQEALPEIQFPKSLSDVSKVACTFLCLISNDDKGTGIEVCKNIKPIVLHKLADVPPLSSALSEYLDNTPSI